MVDDGDAINMTNLSQNYKIGSEIGVREDTNEGGNIKIYSLDGDLTTNALTDPGEWSYLDLGAVYALDRVFVYISPGSTLSSESIQYNAYPSGAESSGDIGGSWVDLDYTTTGTEVAGSARQPWGPVYAVEASGSGDEFAARWLRLKTTAGAEMVHSVFARLAFSHDYDGIYLSETDGGSPISTDAYNNLITSIGNVQQGQLSSTKELWFVNNSGQLTDCKVSFVGQNNLYTSSDDKVDRTAYTSLEIAQSESGPWYNYRSGVMTITESGQSSGVVTESGSVPIYLRWNSPSGATLGPMDMQLRFWYNIT